jgi:hypothetical protein
MQAANDLKVHLGWSVQIIFATELPIGGADHCE